MRLSIKSFRNSFENSGISAIEISIRLHFLWNFVPIASLLQYSLLCIHIEGKNDKQIQCLINILIHLKEPNTNVLVIP